MKRAFIVLLLLAACAREQQSSSAKAKSASKVPPVPSQEESSPKTEIGDLMPAYSARYLDGKPFDLAREKGSVVLLNVWATWCSPCRFETPELQALHDKYSARGFKVIGVSVDEGGADAVKQFITENKVTYPIALDADGRVANVLRTTVLPTSVIIGRDGRILWRKIGAVMPNETSALEAVVKQALAKKS
jgi:cytochrome c biogenesis protein CcmG/thiol:disulfide interchange protein DsbE